MISGHDHQDTVCDMCGARPAVSYDEGVYGCTECDAALVAGQCGVCGDPCPVAELAGMLVCDRCLDAQQPRTGRCEVVAA